MSYPARARTGCDGRKLWGGYDLCHLSNDESHLSGEEYIFHPVVEKEHKCILSEMLSGIPYLKNGKIRRNHKFNLLANHVINCGHPVNIEVWYGSNDGVRAIWVGKKEYRERYKKIACR